MKGRASMVVAGGVALSAVLLLTLLTPEPGSYRGTLAAKSVFRQADEHSLTSQTLVDQLIALQLSQQIVKVGWSNAVLSIDIAADSSLSESEVESVFLDVSKLVRFSFQDIDNVNRLLVRFLETNDSGKTGTEFDKSGNEKGTLLFSADVRINDAWLREDSIPTDYGSLQLEKWQNRLRIHYTKAWAARTGSVNENEL